ncbi:hypothetical protein NH8B_2116 [Pseudogulbenkiania sp. NH8B]|uniref:hypothetical protein n=1 Tax=Pseudogulbenkiania sp. (strain NH8B) TaxID=748280 RepID=UPI0002279BB8|nr:hypothetical protein NH8B_1685 [Pseudogulbenkiania sp. NH8B]BAK76931.1 hypothetical protein NH8B_2116 [Pseudogulbenkiania sp. NH8B]
MTEHDYALTFGLDGVLIPVRAAVKLTQRYERLGGSTLLRTRSGKGVLQSHWHKWRTELTGTGWMPAPLGLLDPTVPHVLDCVAPRAVTVGTPVVERPDIPGQVRDGFYIYWPRLTGFITVTEDTDPRALTWGWTLTLEEQ